MNEGVGALVWPIIALLGWLLFFIILHLAGYV